MTLFYAVQAANGSFENQDNPVVTYIDKYKEIAQSEMSRVGIPASIKLAQGILESNSGQSTLAQKANNHFGIKCGKYWEGGTFYREDDDFKNGKLIKSCFRKFSSPTHSFMAHSDFLTNLGSQYRYGFLFDLDPLDYESWAHGLKSAGYATDSKYAYKLISIIEKYQLYLYDTISDLPRMEEDIVAMEVKESPIKTRIDDRHNEVKRKRRDDIMDLEVTQKIHTFQKGETMSSLARKYNIDIDLLYFKNRMPNGTQPKPGEKIVIDGIIQWGTKKPKVDKNYDQSEESYLFEDGSMTITIH